jgi:hypothetical protein
MREGGAGTATWGAIITMWEILAPGWYQRHRARFWRSDGEGSTASWAGGQNMRGRQNRGEDGGNGILTLIKSSSVRITGKPDKVGLASGSGTGIMSSNVFPNSNTRIWAQTI